MTYTGDLGYEIWIAPEYQRYLFDLIWDAGKEFDMRMFGFRALITMRLEKNFGTWYREFRPIYTPLESGMERAMKFDHEFIGRAAVEAEMKTGSELTSIRTSLQTYSATSPCSTTEKLLAGSHLVAMPIIRESRLRLVTSLRHWP
jgi:dimethylglycine dehydrogenase